MAVTASTVSFSTNAALVTCNISSNRKAEKQKQKVNKLGNRRVDVLGGHLATPWVQPHRKPQPTEHHLHRPQSAQWCHIREGVTLPMPTDRVFAAMTREFVQRVEGQPVGPVTSTWRRGVFDWARNLKNDIFGRGGQVTGLWSQAANRFKKRLRYMGKQKLTAIMREVASGFSHPFATKPRANIFVRHNHPNLAEKCYDVLDNSIVF